MSEMNLIPQADYVAACDAIREKDGTTGLIKSGEMAQKIRDIPAGGITDLTIQTGTFLANQFMANTNFAGLKNFDVIFANLTGNQQFGYSFQQIKGCENITLDFRKDIQMNLNATFYGSDFVTIRLPDNVKLTGRSQSFSGCHSLVQIIGTLDFTNAGSNRDTFSGCDKLETVLFTPDTISKDLWLIQSPLLNTVCIQSIISGLADLSSTVSQTLTLHPDVKAKLTPEQLTAISSKNWTLA